MSQKCFKVFLIFFHHDIWSFVKSLLPSIVRVSGPTIDQIGRKLLYMNHEKMKIQLAVSENA